MKKARTVWNAALAVPLMLCVSGEVTCKDGRCHGETRTRVGHGVALSTNFPLKTRANAAHLDLVDGGEAYERAGDAARGHQEPVVDVEEDVLVCEDHVVLAAEVDEHGEEEAGIHVVDEGQVPLVVVDLYGVDQ